jgi:hypothetical protein
MYREGILPSGKPMSATRPEGGTLSGSAFACVGCHLRSGTGKGDETGLTPPIHAPRLFEQSFRYYPNLTLQERMELLPEAVRSPLRRPAYTDASLITAIKNGVNPEGQPLSPVMPHYHLTDREGEILVSYLKSLSLELSSGVTETTLSFATVVTEGVVKEDREVYLATLQRQVEEHNQVYEKSLKKVYRRVAMKEMALPMRRWSLAVWEMKGAPATWPAQLEERYQAAPVFAFVGGIADGSWHPIHAFCEGWGIPCILPLTDYPVIAPKGSYTLYFSGGFYQEGATAGAYVAATLEETSGKTVIQITENSPQSRELSRGFRDTFTERGMPKALEVMVPAEGLSDAFLSKLLSDQHGDTTLVLWTGRKAFPVLEEVAAGANKPTQVLMSASYLGDDLWNLPQVARPLTLLTYPYRLPKPAAPGQGATEAAPVRSVAAGDEHRVRSRAHALMQVVDEGVRRMGRDFYRDNFLDRIGLMDDKKDSDYLALRFSPGQPWLSTACLLVRVSPGSSQTLLSSTAESPR